MRQAITGAKVFDGECLQEGAVLLIDGAEVLGLSDHVPPGHVETALPGGIIAPGMIDLQVNGGGGRMVDGTMDAAGLVALCSIHARLGATGILPTLITDRPEATQRLIDAAVLAAGTAGLLGLHLEGPHLDPRRKGAHDASLIRPMTEADVTLLCHAAAVLPALMVTLAPASSTPEQIGRLSAAGVIVSLGHSDCTGAEARAAIAAGAKCATHLFNAMSQIGNREPGLAGTVLTTEIACGLIADGIHVHADVMRLALTAKANGVFLVSDCMAAAGTDQMEFTLGNRRILRRDGRLTLEDGTLAGADLTLPRAVRVLVTEVGIPLERALAMASRIPADVIGRTDLGRIAPGGPADLVALDQSLDLAAVWQGGKRVV